MASASRKPIPFGPPRIMNDRVIQLGLFLCLLVPFFVPIPYELRRHPVISHLGDQVHVPLLAALTLALYWFGPLRGRLRAAALVAMAAGGAIEFLQILVGRSALFMDFVLDVAGVGITVGLVLWRGWHRRSGLALMLLIALALGGQLYYLPGVIMGSRHARDVFPVLADFQGLNDRWLWAGTYDANLEFSTDEASGNTTLVLTGGPPSPWPGAQMGHFPPDWTGYSTLKLNVRHRSEGKETVPFIVRVDDFRSRRDHAWIKDNFLATDTWQTFSMPLGERMVVQETRPFEFHDVYKLLVFLGDRQDSNSIEIDNIRLE